MLCFFDPEPIVLLEISFKAFFIESHVAGVVICSGEAATTQGGQEEKVSVKKKHGGALCRDSKLTRLLQSSMTGKGARICVIANITPASSQAEETHSTLKFATRAKKVPLLVWESVCISHGGFC